MKILSICDKEFKKYGKVIDNVFFDKFLTASKNIDVPESGCAYKASLDEFETQEINSYYYNYFGKMPVQIGYCWGRNALLNAVEWHKSSEVNCALEDFVIFIGLLQDVDEDGKYDTSKMQAFYVEKGQAFEMYATTLHFCPAKANGKVFKNVVILPKGTNLPLESKSEDKMLIANNKWLIAHPECKKQVDLGRVIGLVGENFNIDKI